jgi:hypothetical protein
LVRKILAMLAIVSAAACGKNAGSPAAPSSITGPSTGPVIVKQCQAITAPGSYTLGADISSVPSGCLTVSNVSDVAIDCDGHSISSTGPVPNGGYAITVKSSSRVTIRGCTVLGSIAVDGLQDSEVISNRIAGSYTQDNSSRVRFTGNTVTFDRTKPAASGIVALYFGSGNTVSGNQLDGGWDGNVSNWGNQGADDGIQLTNESGDVVQDNTIRNAWDAGIEGVGVVNNTLIATNVIANIGYAGIGSYHGTNWTGDTIRGNQVTQSPSLACIEFSDNRQSAQVSTAVFQNNLFENNLFRSPTARPPSFGGGIPPALLIRLDPPAAFPVIAGNNVIRNNDLGAPASGLLLFPEAAFSQ